MPMIFKMYDETGRELFDLNKEPVLRLKETVVVDYNDPSLTVLNRNFKKVTRKGLSPGKHVASLGVVVPDGLVIYQFGAETTRYYSINIYEF